MSKQKYADKLAKAVFPGIQGGPHENLIAAKAVAFGEALKPEFHDYCLQVIKNAQTLALSLQKKGCKIVSGGTDNHIVLVDVFGSMGVTGKQAEKALEEVGLSVNKNMVPYDVRKPLDPSGIRIGTPAATTRGMKEEQMEEIAEIFYEALKNNENHTVLESLKLQVQNLCKKFPLYT